MFDTEEARKALDRIDVRWLADEERRVVAEVSERAAKVEEEAEELAAVTAEVLAEHRPPAASARRGCLSILGLACAVSATAWLLLA